MTAVTITGAIENIYNSSLPGHSPLLWEEELSCPLGDFPIYSLCADLMELAIKKKRIHPPLSPSQVCDSKKTDEILLGRWRPKLR